MPVNKKKIEAVYNLPAFQALLKSGFCRDLFIMSAPTKPGHGVSMTALNGSNYF